MQKSKLNFVFFGTPDVASETLEILKKAGLLPSVVVTAPDAKSGRGLQMQASPAAVFAEENKIPYLKPEKLDEEFINNLKTEEYDLFIVVAYGKIMPENLINLPKLGSINIHYSLLPKYRGASPVESAVLNGDTVTGVTIQKMAFKMDTGPILAVEKTEILPDEKAEELKKRLIQIGGELLVKILPGISENKITSTIQNETEATYCKKIKKEDGLVNMEKTSASDKKNNLYNKFKAYAKWPRTYFFRNERRIIITDAVLEDGEFKIKKVLPEGKKEITWEEFNKQS